MPRSLRLPCALLLLTGMPVCASAGAPASAGVQFAQTQHAPEPPAENGATRAPLAMPFPPSDPDWAGQLTGRWRYSDGRSCARGYGTVAYEGATLRFEWRLPSGGLNIAIERIDDVSGNFVTTTVVSDVGTPNPEVGNRVRYEFRPDRWLSENLATRERGVHLRC